MTETEKRIIGIAKKHHAAAVGAAENAHDGFSGRLTEQYGWLLVGMYAVLHAQRQEQAAKQVLDLIDDLNSRYGNGETHVLDQIH